MAFVRTGVLLLTGFVVFAGVVRAQLPEAKPGRGADRYGDPLPEGAVARLGTARFRDGEGFASLAFTPDGKSLYTRRWFVGGITEWDVATGKAVRTIEPNLDLVSEVAVAPDGKTLAFVGKDGLLRLWDVGSRKSVLNVKAGERVWKIVFSPRGRYLGLADQDGSFCLRELPSGKEISGPLDRETAEDRGQTGDSMEVQCVAFSSDENYLVLGRLWRSPLVWNLARGKLVRPFARRRDTRGLLAMLSGSKELLTIDGATVTIAPVDAEKPVRRFTVAEEGEVSAFALSSDGKILATLRPSGKWEKGRRGVTVWDVKSGTQIGAYTPVGESYRLAFSPDDKSLVTVGPRSLRFWVLPQAERGKEVQLMERGTIEEPYGAVNSLALALGGRQILAAGEDGVFAWDLAERKLVQRLAGPPTFSGRLLAVRPDGRMVLAEDDRRCGAWSHDKDDWNPDMGKDRFGNPGWLYHCLAYSPDGRYIAVGLRKSEGYHITGPCPSTFFIDQNGFGKLDLDPATRKDLEMQDIAAAAFSPDSKVLSLASGERYNQPCVVRLLEMATRGKQLKELTFHDGSVRALAFSPKGDLLVAVGGKQKDPWSKSRRGPAHPGIVLWNPTTWRELRTLKGHEGMVNGVAFSPDGKLLATAGEDRAIRLWDVATGNTVAVLKGHRGAVNAVVFSSDSKNLYSGSDDTIIFLWDVQACISRRLGL